MNKGPLPLTEKELLELALWLEKTGAEFYRMVAEESNNEEIRQFFLRLLGMEMDHQERIWKMLLESTEAPPSKKPFDEGLTSREYFLQLRSLAAAELFPQGLKFLTELDSYTRAEQALPLALRIEEKHIEIYRRLTSFSMPYRKLAILNRLIAEEEKHLAEVKAALAKVEASAGSRKSGQD